MEVGLVSQMAKVGVSGFVPGPGTAGSGMRDRCWAGIVVLSVMGGPAWAAPKVAPTELRPYTHEVAGKMDGMVAMRDGVKLFTRTWLPQGEGPWPTVLMRSPYGMMHSALDHRCKLLAQFGYACVWQDVRGQGKSEGVWVPFVHEADDGEDTLAWLTSRGWQNDHIAWMGESYLAGTGWAVAERFGPEVKAAVLSVFGTDMHEVMFEGGLVRHDLMTAWMALMPARGQRIFAAGAYHRALQHRPRATMDLVAARREVPWFRAWIASSERSAPMWSDPVVAQMARAPSAMEVPVLMLAGWSDAFLGPQLDTWQQLASRDRSTLVVGPWQHMGKSVGDLDFDHVDDDVGRDGDVAQVERVLDWLDHHLQGAPARLPVGEVLTYVMGEDRWAVREAWPPPTQPSVWYPAPGGDPVACSAPLVSEVPAGGEVRFTYDPTDPTPSRGGAGILAGALPLWFGVPPGPIDQKGLCADRTDLLGFVSAPLAAPLHLAGPVRAHLVVASDAPDTAFAVRLVERTADGRDLHVREGIMSLSMRDGPETRVTYAPGTEVQVSVETWPVEYVFAAGSQLVLQIGSSSFPKYEAHPNTAVSWVDAPSVRVAHQRVILGASRVELPVVVQGPADTDPGRAQDPSATTDG